LRAKDGCPVFAAHDGVVIFAGKDGGGGISVQIATTMHGEGYKTIYYHLKKVLVKEHKKVKAGQKIGLADNTGKYTTGDHLHFGLKEIVFGSTTYLNNGYKGAIDPAPFFEKNWDKSRAYHRYGRPRNWPAEFKMRFKNPWIHRQLKKRKMHPILGGEAVNALVYGGWDFESVINPAMYYNFAYLKKSEYLRKIKPFH